jgi:predicted LPLAT superfamily acyltransferase
MTIRKTREWEGKTGGSKWGQKGLVFLFHHCSVFVGYAFMAFVIPFYMLFARKGYKATYRYFRSRQGFSVFRSFINTYRNYFIFGQVVLDRFAIFSGRMDYQVEIENKELVQQWFNSDKGFVLLSSHVGNFEICGYLLKQNEKRIHALSFGGETAMINENRRKLMERNNVSLIQVKDDLSHVFAIGSALENNEVVSMPADRNLGSTKTVTCDFLRGKADFPLGPFALAVQFDVPILSAFVMKTGLKKYRVLLKPICLDDTFTGSKQERTRLLATLFVRHLEEVVKAYPLQWFNFYKFWNE